MHMLDAGMSVARFNMSHGNHATHAAHMKTARAASRASNRPLAILQDLSGPKIRIGELNKETVDLEEGHSFTLTTKPCVGDASHAYVSYRKLPTVVKRGMHIFLNDGKIHLKVTSVTQTDIRTTIIVGGAIRARRGVNIPDAHFTFSALTPKDKRDVLFGLEQDVDIITLSFVRSAADIKRLRSLLKKRPHVNIVAKIETKAAVTNLDEIIEAADALMVARGDLAIEVPPERVPLIQKQIIRAANRAGKPVITATQMLDSMRVSTVPTRAEVNDVANAVLDGTDAVMLSDETAIGLHPAKTVTVMSRIALETEHDTLFIDRQDEWDFEPKTTYDAVSRSIVKTARTTKARAIVAFSESGHTGRMVARYRPHIPILVLTPNRETFNTSLLTYGCVPVLIHKVKQLKDARTTAKKVLMEHGICQPGDVYVLGAGLPFGTPGATNMMIVVTL